MEVDKNSGNLVGSPLEKIFFLDLNIPSTRLFQAADDDDLKLEIKMVSFALSDKEGSSSLSTTHRVSTRVLIDPCLSSFDCKY